MKLAFSLATLTTACLAQLAAAATVTPGDLTPGGITYRWTVGMGEIDAASFERHVGAWSWEDNALFDAAAGEQPVGWTHTSDWVALTLAEPTLLTIRLARQANVPWPNEANPNRVASTASMFPSFTIWSGSHNEKVPQSFADVKNDGTRTEDWHDYTNFSNVAWAPALSYIGHVNNSTETSAERTWALPAGSYSIVLGSNAPATDTARQGYLATLTTTPVPEPGTTGLLAGGLSMLALRRRRVR